MGIKRKDAQAGALGWTALNALWGTYAAFTTARDLATDAGEVRKMLVDPPIELPWIFASLGIISLVLIWRYWRDDGAGREESENPITSPMTIGDVVNHGPGIAVGINSGTITQVPEPTLQILNRSEWQDAGDHFSQTIHFRIRNAADARAVKIELDGEGVRLDGYLGGNMHGYEPGVVGPPNQIGGIVVRADKPRDDFRIRVQLL